MSRKAMARPAPPDDPSHDAPGRRDAAGASRSAAAEPAGQPPATDDPVHEDRRWRDNGWTAQVIKNEDDDGWAVSMTPDGRSEPALIGPWTMGRDKKNPKPLDTAAFNTLVKTAGEFVRRQEQQLHAALHRSVEIAHGDGRITVTLDIEPDEDNPRAMLSAVDADGTLLASQRVPPGFTPDPGQRGGLGADGVRALRVRPAKDQSLFVW